MPATPPPPVPGKADSHHGIIACGQPITKISKFRRGGKEPVDDENAGGEMFVAIGQQQIGAAIGGCSFLIIDRGVFGFLVFGAVPLPCPDFIIKTTFGKIAWCQMVDFVPRLFKCSPCGVDRCHFIGIDHHRIIHADLIKGGFFLQFRQEAIFAFGPFDQAKMNRGINIFANLRAFQIKDADIVAGLRMPRCK